MGEEDAAVRESSHRAGDNPVSLGMTGFLSLPHVPGTGPAELPGAEQCKG